ncbi:MAG: exodeoxyribonuclease VII small subunit [Clostridiaceae bacterium]|nr:exodeoxyribonuclease VII small subunit [Bacillota bacterium]NLN51282.1 exodeoxyribonuclease VII small subunit [Clostridiaceae bacterium]
MTEKLPLDLLQEQSITEEKGQAEKQKSPSSAQKEPESFQKAVQELKTIVEQLENVQGDLDKSVALFQRGMHLAKWSEGYLDRMEEQITEIIADNDLQDED